MAYRVERFVGASCAAGTNAANLLTDVTGIGSDLTDKVRKKLAKWGEQNKKAEPIDEKIDELYMKLDQANEMQQIKREMERQGFKTVAELDAALTDFFGNSNDGKSN